MLEQYYRLNEAMGLNILLRQDNTLQLSACEIIVDGQKLNFSKKVEELSQFEDLKKHFPTIKFIAVNLTGKGILQKQIEKTTEIDQNTFSRIFPNANMDDFYVQHFPSGEHSFVSIIRKAEADKYIIQLKKESFIPLQLSLGPFAVDNIISQLNIYDAGLVFNGNIIKRNERAEWLSCSYNETAISPFPLKIESESLSEKLLIPYAAAFQLVMASRVHPIQSDALELHQAYTTLIADRKLKVNGALILAVFFILLLVNFALFSWLNTANNKLSDKVSQSAQSYTDIQGINDKIKEKQTLLQDLGWDGGINKSGLVDRLASLLPDDVTLQELNVNPIDVSSSRTQKSLAFYNRQIRVTGLSEKIIPVNEWIARVKVQPWVKNIQLDSYTFNSELSKGQFTIIINY